MTEQSPKVCQICGGVGKIRVNEETWKRCYCSFARVFKSRVGMEIATAKNIEASPLYVPGSPSEIVDRTRENLFIKGWWSDILSHLKFVLMCKHVEYDLQYNTLIVNDERLKAVYLGAEAYNNKAKKKREMDATYNTLADFIGADYHLVIIRLGFLGHKNVAMPGILKEALLLRQAINRPTWLIESPDSIWGPGHRSYSDEVGDYVSTHYKVVDLTVEKEGPVVPRGVIGSSLEEDEGMHIDDDDEPVQVVMPKARMQVESKEFDLLNDDKKRKSKSKGGKGGGGPL